MLRPYQLSLYTAAMSALNTNRRVLAQCQTGGGKTIIATVTTQDVESLEQRIWFVCHRAELVHQTSITFAKAGVAHSFIAAGRYFDPKARVHICSIDTLKARLAKIAAVPDLIIWDECHHVGAAGWTAVMNAFPNAYHLGLSATPVRLDGQGLDKHFDAMVVGPSTAWLIEQGFLSPFKIFSPSAPDMRGVGSRAGDYATGEAEKAMTPKLTGDAIAHWKQHANGLRTVVFAVSVKHSQAVAQAYNDAGIPAAHLDGNTPKDERAETIRKFADGEILVLSNVSLFGEGFDLSAIAGRDVTIDCVVLLRPTQSLSLYLQQVGRALRPFVNKTAIILDHAGNFLRHGFPDNVREWSLQGKPKNAKDDEAGPPPPVTCSGCWQQICRPAPACCPSCGTPLVVPKELPRVSKGQLAEMKREAVEAEKAAKELAKVAARAGKAKALIEKQDKRLAERREEWKCTAVSELIALAVAREYQYPAAWAKQWCKARNKHF
jgi:DNA repair protein RadD